MYRKGLSLNRSKESKAETWENFGKKIEDNYQTNPKGFWQIVKNLTSSVLRVTLDFIFLCFIIILFANILINTEKIIKKIFDPALYQKVCVSCRRH